MARKTDYPRKSQKNSLELAEAVSAFAGSCTPELAAEKMHKKMGGSFAALIGAAVKYGLITNKAGKLSVTPLFRSLKLAYNEDERVRLLRQSFLSAPLFREIVTRFDGQRLPMEHFEKMLIREFEVPEDMASRVATYFFDGGKQNGLISGDGVIQSSESPPSTSSPSEREEEEEEEQDEQSGTAQPITARRDDVFSVRITGPGLDTTIAVEHVEDLDIVNALLKKVQKAVQTRE